MPEHLSRFFIAATFLSLLPLCPPAWAALPSVGSSNEAVIEPGVPVPNETPCVVQLVQAAKFGANAVNFSYTPPAACPGPWAKVVLHMSISLNKGIQFDRSGTLFLAGIPLWFGTTAEPSPTLAPSWSFQKDVTDYTAIYKTAQTGYLQIANYQSNVYTSTIAASASLVFYPATATAPAPVTADMVLPLPAGGGVATLNDGTSLLQNTLTLPRNILHATLDLYLQGQSGDEFWYSCVPNDVADELEECGGGPLREGEITIDAKPAGVAPVFPWIFTGGIDPLLWQPIPGVQTLDFTAFHADLSPFAGVLSNGKPHDLAVSVYGDNGYFSATGALRLFLDKNAATVSGGLISDTLVATPIVTTKENLATSQQGVISGTVNVSDQRNFTISGSVTGSAGTIVNTLHQMSTFINAQAFYENGTDYLQKINQSTNITIASTTTGASNTSSTETLSYPLKATFDDIYNNDGSVTQPAQITLQFTDSLVQSVNGVPVSQNTLSDSIGTADTLALSPSYSITGNSGQSAVATYARSGSSAPCYGITLTATANVLTSVTVGCH